MEFVSEKANVSLDLARIIDASCDRFESARQAGRAPDLSDFLQDAPESAQPTLLRELVAIELHYRRLEQGDAQADHALLSEHSNLMPELAQILDELRTAEQGPGADGDLGTAQLADMSDVQLASPPASPRKDSQGLKIRCPHCHHAVELLADSPFDDVTCGTCGSAFSLVEHEGQTPDAEPLERLGRFELVSRLGLGGFGTVWKARDTELDRIVAVKIPRKSQIGAREIEQFFREARAAAQLRHPNIVTVHEVGRDENRIFIVSDYVRGVALSDWLTATRPANDETARLIATIAEALHYAHDQGVVHRDLKPSNIMIDPDGAPHIMDFGLAKREVGEITMTMDGQILGTPAYMSPEQAQGKGHWTDRRSDIYSLGVVLFQLMTGELPFRGNAQMQMHQKLTEDVPHPASLNRHAPADLSTICLRCLQFDPNKRYATAQQVADELTRYLKGIPIKSRPVSTLARIWRWARRHPARAAATGLGATLAIVGPLAALIIDAQRRDLQTRFDERSELIVQYRSEVGALTNDRQTLRNELDQLQGKSGDLSGVTTGWKWDVAREYLAERAIEHEKLLQEDVAPQTTPLQQRTRAHVGLATLHRAFGHDDIAIQHYEKAVDLLQQLGESEPQRRSYEVALADCWSSLAELYRPSAPQQSDQAIQAALAIRSRLVQLDSHRVSEEIDYLDSLLDSVAIQPDPITPGQPTERLPVKEHLQRLRETLRSDPTASYQLTRELNLPVPTLDTGE